MIVASGAAALILIDVCNYRGQCLLCASAMGAIQESVDKACIHFGSQCVGLID